jgi:hypothetical protein
VKLTLDENIPSSAAGRLAALGFDADTVLDEALGGCSDADVWVGRFVVATPRRIRVMRPSETDG